jgi:hypothetical protein
MGTCCASREKPEPIQLPHCAESNKVLEIEKYAMSLLASEDWDLTLDEEICTIRTRVGSEFDDILPVVFVELSLTVDVDLERVYNLLCDP